MKKSLLKSIASVAVFSLAAGTSFADTGFNDLKFYAGAGLDYAKYSIDKSTFNSNAKLKDKGMGLLIPILGVKFHENFAMEAGYSFNKKISIKQTGQTDTSFKVRNAYLDLVGIIPVANQFDLIGGLGVGRLMAKKGAGTDSNMEVKNKFGWRAKFGAQYNCTDNVAFRALVAYQRAGSKLKNQKRESKFIKNMKSIGLSAIYTF